jgi:hypothetical protein
MMIAVSKAYHFRQKQRSSPSSKKIAGAALLSFPAVRAPVLS